MIGYGDHCIIKTYIHTRNEKANREKIIKQYLLNTLKCYLQNTTYSDIRYIQGKQIPVRVVHQIRRKRQNQNRGTDVAHQL